jgi:hypothetical protein
VPVNLPGLVSSSAAIAARALCWPARAGPAAPGCWAGSRCRDGRAGSWSSACWPRWMDADARGNRSRPWCVRWVPPEPCREGAMTTSPGRGLSIRAGALLGAVAVLVAGCAAGGGSGSRADRAGGAPDAIADHRTAARSSGPVAAHRAAGLGRVRQRSGSRSARAASPVPCALPVGDPVGAGGAPGSPVAVQVCQRCGWCGCACAWACCGCAPGRWSPRSSVAWVCCSRWLRPLGGGDPPVPLACAPPCSSLACPVEPQVPVPAPARAPAGSIQGRSPRGVTAGAR